MKQSIKVFTNRLACFVLGAVVLAAGAAWVHADLFSTVQAASQATITSDKPDYVPGQTVTLTGNGWQPGEIASIVMAVDPITHADVAITAVADQDGKFTDRSYTVQRSDLGVTFNVVATGDKGSEAHTTFTDHATIAMTIVGSGNVSTSGGSDPVGPPGNLDCSTGSTGACSVEFNGGDIVTMTATAAPGFTFTGWTTPTGTVYCTGTTNPCTINTPNGSTNDDTMTATFTANTTTTAVTSSLNPSNSGQSVTFTAKVAPGSGATVPTGNVQFVVDGSNFGAAIAVSSCSPSPDACATTSTSALAVGNHTVTAAYTSTTGQNKGFINFQAEPANGDTITVGSTVYAFRNNTGQCVAGQRCVARVTSFTTESTNLANAVAGTCFTANAACTGNDPAVTAVANSPISGGVVLTNTTAGAVTWSTNDATNITLAPTTSIPAPPSAFGNSSGTLSGGQTVNSTSNPVPAITTLSPTSAAAGTGAQTLTINGSNFVSTSTATFNGVAHTVTFVSATQLTIPLTAGDQATQGTFPVVVTNPAPGGGISNTVNFTVGNPVPAITTLSPTSALAGAAAQTLTINGSNFVSTSAVTYGGVAHTATFVSAAQLTIQLTTGDQATAGTFAVVVTNPAPNGGTSNSVNFTVNNPVPTITTLSPSSATAGAAAQTLTINGTNFVTISTATFNGVAHTVTFVSAVQVTIQLSAADQLTGGTFPVVVTNPAPGGGASNSVNFTVSTLVPAITTLSPSSATAGASAQTLTINGTSFVTTSTATYNGVAHTVTFVNSTQVTIPLTAADQATAGTFPVVVTNPAPGGGASNIVNFTVNNPVPTITTLSPTSAIVGTATQTLTINGTNFVSTSAATYNGVAHTTTFVNATKVTIQLSAADQATVGSFPVIVTNPTPGGGASNTVNFAVNNPVPAITTLAPSSASAGAAAQTLTINGSNFLSNSTATYNGVTHTVTFVSAAQLTIPLTAADQATAGTFPVVVTNPAPGGGASNSVNFTVNNLVPTITTLSPSSASAGAAAQTLTINGTNFLSTSTVTYNAVAHTATFVNFTQLTIQLTTGDQATAGNFAVVVTNPAPGGGASNSVSFTVNNLIPTITTLSPASATAGAAAQTLTINGTNFVSTSTATYNGTAHTVTFVNSTQVKIQLTLADQAVSGNYPVAVTNPAPGGGASNSVNFTVNNLAPTIITLSPASASAGAAAQTLTINGTNFLATSTATYNGVVHAVTFVNTTQVKINLTTGDQATQGSFPVVVTNPPPAGGASNAVNFVVGLAPVITSANTTTFIAGQAGSFQVTATGNPAPTFTETGALPGTVTLSASGLLSGTPDAGQTDVITITASNGVTPNATQRFTLQVNEAPFIDPTTTSKSFALNTAGTFTFTTLFGTPASTWSETGALPAGITLSAGGVLSGTPTQIGTFAIVVTADNGVPPAATENFTIQVGKGGTYTQPFNQSPVSHGWVYTSLSCTTLTTCSSSTNDATAGDCNPAPCVSASTAVVLNGAQSGYFSHTYAWTELGVPKGSTVTAVDGSFWDKSVTACDAGTTGGMQIFGSGTNANTEVTSAPVQNLVATDGDTSGATHGNLGSKAVLFAFQPASTVVTLRLNLNPASSTFLGTCKLSADNYNLTISYIPPNSHQVIVASVFINRRTGGVTTSEPLAR